MDISGTNSIGVLMHPDDYGSNTFYLMNDFNN